MTDSHSFCRMLLKTVRDDLKTSGIDSALTAGLSVTKSSLGGYEVQGPNRFYHHASSACCSWCAKSEALETMLPAVGGVKKEKLSQTS